MCRFHKANPILTAFFLTVSMVFCCPACAKDSTSNPSDERKPEKGSQAHGQYKKLALLVGINDYKHFSNLKGSVNDVTTMKQLLVERFGFPDDAQHIHMLTDKQATRDAIIKEMKEHLIAKASNDSIVVFHYSGHGSYMVDADKDEPDGYDETIVPHDSGHEDPYPNQDINDDELNAMLRQLTEKTPNVTFLLDSCHSGTAIRGAELARTVRPDLRQPPKRDAFVQEGTRGLKEGKSGIRLENSRYVLISGSAAQELSYELTVEGKSYGALTWFLADQVRKAGANVTYRDIMDVVKARVTAKYRTQHPQLEGPGEDQLVFGDKSLEPAPFVLASPKEDGKVRLEAGKVHGVTAGSLYDVYPPDTKSFAPDVEPVARLEVVEVDMTTSTAMTKKGKPIVAASRAVEREHRWPDSVLRVYFKDLDKSETLRKIKAEVQKYKHVTSLSTESGYDLLLREHRDEKNDKRYIITEGGDPTEISPRVAVTDPEAVSRVVEQITHWAKWFNILRISNPQHELAIEMALKPETSATGSRGLADLQVNLTLREGEKVIITLTNGSQKDVYVALLDLSSDGSVDVVFPQGGAQEFVAPGKTWSKTLETTVPSGQASVRDILKLFATTSYADFRFMEQGAVRGEEKLGRSPKGERNPLEELLANASMGTTRGLKGVEVGKWTTVEKVLEVRRK